MIMEIAIGQPYVEHLQCLECGYVLWTVVENDGWTSLEFMNTDETEITIFRATLKCPICGAKRPFYSEPLSGKRLGIV